MDRRQHSSIFDVRSFRGTDSESDHYFVGAGIKGRLAVNKQMVKKMGMGRFNLKKLNNSTRLQ
jgi:hypothetical protein